jgi:hypothetical protein
LQAAADEGRDELQDLWAGLLSSAMVDRGRRVRRAFIDAVKALEPDEAVLLEIMHDANVRYLDRQHHGFMRRDTRQMVEAMMSTRGMTADDISLCVQRLQTLGCIDSRDMESTLSPFGKALLRACRPVKSKTSSPHGEHAES